MIIELGKHKGLPLSQLSDEELKEMSDGMTGLFYKLTKLIGATNEEIAKRNREKTPSNVSAAKFKLDPNCV